MIPEDVIRMKKWLRTGLLLLFCALFLLSAWMLLDYYLASQKQKSQFDELAQIVEQNTPATTLPPQTQVPEDTVPDTTAPEFLPEYTALSELNPDLVGWLQIEDTQINYPVMQTPDRPNYYLYRDFYGQYSGHGCLYAAETCAIDTPSDNIIIYGHHMKDGSMLAGLLDYRSKDFWQAHSTVLFSSLKEHRTYEIFAVFITTANEGQGFSYHRFVDAQNADEFNDYVNQCKALSLYDTGITPQYGDKLITLSTCEYTQENGRFVVVAKQVS